MKQVIKFLAYLLCYVFYPISYFFPRTDKILVFGSYRGAFNDNSKYLFLYSCKCIKDRKIVWISTKKSTVCHIRSLGYRAYHVVSLKGLYYALRSKIWFVNSYTSDIAFCLAGRAKVVNLWHGVPMKAIEFGITKGDLAKRYVERDFWDVFFHPAPFRRPDYMVSTTDFFDDVFSASFRIDKSQCLQTGCPRNRMLQMSIEQVDEFVCTYESQQTKDLVDKIRQYKTVFVYMPTWRDSQADCFANGFDLKVLNDFVAQQDSCVLMKPHANTFIDKSVEYSNLYFLDGNVDMYCILPYTHVLITDYSSVIYDYILMPEKSVVLFHYDYEEYVNSREFIFDLKDNIVGKKVYSFDELLSTIKNADYEMDENLRQRIIDKFWGKTATYDSCYMILEKLSLLSSPS